MTRKGIQRLAVLGVGLLIMVGTVAAGYFVRQSMIARRIEESRSEGLTLYQAGEYEAALPALGQVIARVKDDPEVLRAYAECRAAVPMPNGGHLSRAIAAAKAATFIEPGNVRAKELLLGLYGEAGWLTELVELADEIIAIDSTNSDARTLLTRALRALGRNDEALANANSLIEVLPESLSGYQQWSELALSMGKDAKEVVERAESVKDQFRGNPEYFLWLSLLEGRAGDADASIKSARTAANLPPTSAAYVGQLVNWLESLHDLSARQDSQSSEPTLQELADAVFERSLNDPEIGQAVAGDFTKRAFWADRNQDATALAQRIEPDSEEAAARWAALVLIGDRASTGFGLDSTVVQPFVASARDTEWELLFAATSALREKSPEQALALLREFQPSSGETQAVALYLRGVALKRIGEFRGAASALREAAEMRGIARDRAWRALGDVYTFLGQFDNAQNAYTAMTDRANDRLSQFDFVLVGAERSGDVVLVRQVLDLLRGEPEEVRQSPGMMARIARAMILSGEAREGIELAKQLIGKNPPPDPMGLLGLVRTLDTYAPDVGAELLASLGEQTDNIELLASQAVILAQGGKLDDARAMLQEEIDSRETPAALPYRRALLRVLDQFDLEAATVEAGQLSEDYPESSTAQLAALRSRAIWEDLDTARTAVLRLRESIGEESLAWRTYNARAVLEEEPTDAQINSVILDLATVLRETPDDLDSLILTGRAYRRIAESRRDLGRETEVLEFVELAARYYRRASGPSIRAVAFRPLIEMLDEFGRTNDVLRELDRFQAIESLDQSELSYRRDLFIRFGRWADAAEDQFLLAGYSTPESVLDLAVLYIRAGDSPSAANVLEQFLAHEDWDTLYIRSCAALLIEAGYIDRGIEVFESLDEQELDAPIEKLIAQSLAAERQPLRALPYQLKLARDRGRVDDWVAAIRLATATSDDSLVKATIEEASATLPDAPELLAFTDEGSLRQFSLAVVSSISPNEQGAGGALREASSAHGRGELSDEGYLDTLSVINGDDPAYWPAWQVRANFLAATGNREEAVSVAEAATTALPDSSQASRQLVQAYRSVGRIEDAQTEAERLVELSGRNDYEAAVILGMIKAELGDHPGVIDLLARFRDRLERESADGPHPGLSCLAVAYAGTGNATEAATLFGDRLGSGETNWQITALMAALALPITEADAAREWLNMVNDPALALDQAEAYLRLARYSGNPADFERIDTLITELAETNPNAWRWITARLQVLDGEFEDAAQTLGEMISDEPENLRVRALYCTTLSELDGRSDDAIEAVRALRARIDAESHRIRR
jgi:tetratricopeptide (TPR) repeat protein